MQLCVCVYGGVNTYQCRCRLVCVGVHVGMGVNECEWADVVTACVRMCVGVDVSECM